MNQQKTIDYLLKEINGAKTELTVSYKPKWQGLGLHQSKESVNNEIKTLNYLLDFVQGKETPSLKLPALTYLREKLQDLERLKEFTNEPIPFNPIDSNEINAEFEILENLILSLVTHNYDPTQITFGDYTTAVKKLLALSDFPNNLIETEETTDKIFKLWRRGYSPIEAAANIRKGL